MVKSASFTSGKYYIPFIYIFIGITWILTSDAVMNYLQQKGYLPISDWVGSAKGVAYVIITGFLLYTLISKSERDLLKSERQYKDIYLSNPYPIWFFDPESYKFLSVNDTTVSTYGYSHKELLAMTIFDIHEKEDVLSLKQHFSKINQDVYEFGNWRQIKKNSEIIYVSSGSLRSSFNNKPAVMVVIMDITERLSYITERKEKEAEILRQNEQLRKVSWLNSHEIRKPVASLLSLVEMFKGGADQREREQIIERIHKCTWELDQTIRQINKEASELYKPKF
jgi:PAS domain S-box-containing protein